MSRYRKKPVEVEAWLVRSLLTGDETPAFMPPSIQDAYERGHLAYHADHIDIWTLEGTMRADSDDWIIQGVQGELYPCKPEIFAATYESVSGDE